MASSTNKLILFTLGYGVDHRGRSIEEIWALSNEALEYTHDYIQWLFPIPESGSHNDFAPVLTTDAMLWFSRNPALREQHKKSFDRMLKFFGLRAEGPKIRGALDLNERDHPWLRRFDHNHRRISRIIRSLYLCHQNELAESFCEAVVRIGQQQGDVSEATVTFWKGAAV